MKNEVHFSPLSLDDKPLLDEFFAQFNPVISEFTFTNLFCWRFTREHEFTLFEDHLLISFLENKKKIDSLPRGRSESEVISFSCQKEKISGKKELMIKRNFFLIIYDRFWIISEMKEKGANDE